MDRQITVHLWKFVISHWDTVLDVICLLMYICTEYRAVYNCVRPSGECWNVLVVFIKRPVKRLIHS